MTHRPRFDDAALVILGEICAQVESLPDRIADVLERKRAPRRLSAEDEAALTPLLPLIAEVVGDQIFAVGELLTHAELETALKPIGSRQRLGRLLRRGADVDVGGFRIVEIGGSRDGMLRRIVTSRRNPRTGEGQEDRAGIASSGNPVTSLFRGKHMGNYVPRFDPDDTFKGQSYTRALIARAAAYIGMREGNFTSPGDVAEKRWGKTHPHLVDVIKAGVAGGGTGSGEWGAELAQSDARFTGDFIEFLYSMTVFDKLPLRPIPARVHIKGQDGAATGYWVGESKGIPVSKPDFLDVELTPLKVGCIAVCSKELVQDSDPAAELWIRDSIVKASTQRIDTTFLSAAAASSGVSPAGILNGLSAAAPSGADAAAIRADLMTLYSGFLEAKNVSGLVHVMTPTLAKAISLMVNALGQFEFTGLGAKGGTLLGDTVVTGDNVTSGHWILLKPSDIRKIGDSGVEVSMSDSATIEQDSAPQSATDTPAAASANLVSLWQEESVGFKIIRRINYAKRRTSAVAYLDNAEYGGVVS